MTLRTSGYRRGISGLRHRWLSLPALLAAAALMLMLLAGASPAGISAYQGTLYFDGAPSSISGSFQLSTTAPAAQGATPTAAAGVAGSGGLPVASYKYVYVTSSGGVFTASQPSGSASIGAPGNTPMNVSNVPVGAAVYRATIPGSTSTGPYTYVGTNAGPTTTYVDANPSTSGAPLPQADTRVPVSTTGWMAFVPGTSFTSSGQTSVDSGYFSASAPSIPSTCAGWTIDSSAGVTFPAGMWTFNRQLRPDSAPNGVSLLAVAMWKVDTSGNTIPGGTIIPLTDGGTMTPNGASQNVSVSYTTTSPTTLDTNERLCVQFWRHQSTGTSAGGAINRTVWMFAYDPNSRISLHPAPNAFATAALSSPADGLHTQTIPTLAATYSDSEGDAGNITIRACPDAACLSSTDS